MNSREVKHIMVGIDVGIPALNEGSNIKRILTSVSGQNEQEFYIQKIILVSDGSTDSTVEEAKSLGLNNLQIIVNTESKGKMQALGQMFQASKADIIVLLDADTELHHKNTISELILPIMQKRATLTSGRPISKPTHTFVDNVMKVSMALQDYVKAHLKDGHSVYACHGRIIAIRREIFSQIRLKHSDNGPGTDAYLYFFNKSQGGNFEYTPDAKTYFKMPQSFRDFSKQERRFANSQQRQAQIFGNWVFSDYKIPKVLLLKAFLTLFATQPFYFVCYAVFQLTSRIFVKDKTTGKASWAVSASTKNLE